MMFSNTGGTMKCPKNMFTFYTIKFIVRGFCHVTFAFFLKCITIEHIHFRFISSFENYSRNFPSKFSFQLLETFEIPHFSPYQNQMRKSGGSRFTNIKKRSLSRKNYVHNFETGRLITESSFICFLGHFMVLAVILNMLIYI